ncbi:putative ceramidase [Operophtera brumata]|uniref:Neutral ceramidase n=1 Tax=Operophtera brumata TaxID=104452 RepID=A0A0L7LUS4_OPEBR|nr:putative ceramidase [Operophtera brumata]
MALTAWLALACVCTAHALRVGVGIADVTGPPAEMGYAQFEQVGHGIHLRQFARAFVLEDDLGNSIISQRIVFVSVDAAMMGQGVRREKRYGDMYTDHNVIISGTHTHSTPGGFLMDFLFDLPILGFVKETYSAYSIVIAHTKVTQARMEYGEAELLDANINRSPSSYKYDTDKTLAQVRFVAPNDKVLGVINWFAVHPTSMNNTNKLISSDNVGYASILCEKALNGNTTIPGKGTVVCAFASTNLGDVSPNTKGPRCEFSGKPCDQEKKLCTLHKEKCFASGPGRDMFESTKIIATKLYQTAMLKQPCDQEKKLCTLHKEKCFASGPGRDMFESTKIIATKLYQTAMKVLSQPGEDLTGPLGIVHQFVKMPEQEVFPYDPVTETFNSSTKVHGCLPAMGYSFAAGTTDGPGAFDFTQGTTSSNPLWNAVRDFIAEPTDEDVKCQAPKPILLATGRATFPYEWQPHIVSCAVARIGGLFLAAVPGEFTTMSGRRLRNIVAKTTPEAKRVVLAGLSNIYSDYIATPEEYQAQRYEAASTIFGPHTLDIYLNKYVELTEALVSVITPVLWDTAPWKKEFGDCTLQPQRRYSYGDVVTASFVSGHPRNSIRHGRWYMTVEKLESEQDDAWVVIATDADWETKFIWVRDSKILGTSHVNLEWEIPVGTPRGTYRLHHYGNYKYVLGGIYPYHGFTDSFEVT